MQIYDFFLIVIMRRLFLFCPLLESAKMSYFLKTDKKLIKDY